MELDKQTFTHLASIAVENYENEVAFRQGLLAHHVYISLQANWRWWLWRVTYTDILEWIERMYFPIWGLRRKFTESLYRAYVLADHEPYTVAKDFLRKEDKNDNYTLDPEFYNWLVKRQEI